MSESVLDSLLLDNLNVATKNDMFFVQQIPLLCTRKIPRDRPIMKDVAVVLKNNNEDGINEHGELSICEANVIDIIPIQI